MLERLSPRECAAFLLHGLFGMPMDEIAAAPERDARLSLPNVDAVQHPP
ncbi:sigma factor-like helix-turn-helix DNA-binding protein [Falsiroseomonas frigidaquae]|nr:sigma factor-like helix-turn-helix DNA-binding protein [Falsiroseomonas frigidaquae]